MEQPQPDWAASKGSRGGKPQFTVSSPSATAADEEWSDTHALFDDVAATIGAIDIPARTPHHEDPQDVQGGVDAAIPRTRPSLGMSKAAGKTQKLSLRKRQEGRVRHRWAGHDGGVVGVPLMRRRGERDTSESSSRSRAGLAADPPIGHGEGQPRLQSMEEGRAEATKSPGEPEAVTGKAR